MRQLLLCCWLLLFGMPFTIAQKGLKLGLQGTGGVSMAWNQEDFDRESIFKWEPAVAFNAGVLLGYGFTDIISVLTGVGFNQHTASFVHQRSTLESGMPDLNEGKRFFRRAGYIRVPILFEVGSDPNLGAGFCFRIGPTFDFLTGAQYKDERLDGYSNYISSSGIDLSDEITIYTENASTGGLVSTGRKGKVYQDFVIGVTLEIGAQIRFSDNLKMTILAHFEGCSNPEGEAAASFAHNLDRGDFLAIANPVSNPSEAAADAIKYDAEATPFDTTFPNYPLNGNTNATQRSGTWNFMAGLHIGIVYTDDRQFE